MGANRVQLLYRDAFSPLRWGAVLHIPGELLGASCMCLCVCLKQGVGSAHPQRCHPTVSGCDVVLKEQKKPKDSPFHLRNLIFMKGIELE